MDRKGQRREAANWYVEFRDHRGYPHRLVGYTDRGASQEMGRSLERLAALTAVGSPPDPSLSGWLEGLSVEVRLRLAKWGLLTGD